MSWQPIETAPKDRAVLGFWQSMEGRRDHVDRIWWDATFHAEGWDDEEDEPAYRGAWTAGRVASWGYEEYAEEHPTHWMPLPKGPGSQALRARAATEGRE